MSDAMEVESSPKETPKEETSPKALQEAEVDEMKKYVWRTLICITDIDGTLCS